MRRRSWLIRAFPTITPRRSWSHGPTCLGVRLSFTLGPGEHTLRWELRGSGQSGVYFWGLDTIRFSGTEQPDLLGAAATQDTPNTQAVDELASALIRLASDRELRERLSRTGRERFTDQFRHQTMTRRIREVYQSVLEERN